MKTIIIDLDHTLLNTAKLKYDMEQVALGFGVAKEVYDKTYRQTVSLNKNYYGYNLDRHCQAIGKKLNIDKKEIDKLKELMRDTVKNGNYLFNDSATFISEAIKYNYKIILLTRGETDWQNLKINGIKINGKPLNQIAEIIITPYEKSRLIGKEITKSNDSFFISDNINEVKDFKNGGFESILIDRKNGVDLSEAWEIINSHD